MSSVALSALPFSVRSVKNQPSYFADRLYKAMKVSDFMHLLCVSYCSRIAGFYIKRVEALSFSDAGAKSEQSK